MSRFPDAPPGSYVSEEGWLITGQEAWTAEEWAGEWGQAYRARRKGGPLVPQRARRYATEEERAEAKRRASREHMRRWREAEYQRRAS